MKEVKLGCVFFFYFVIRLCVILLLRMLFYFGDKILIDIMNGFFLYSFNMVLDIYKL